MAHDNYDKFYTWNGGTLVLDPGVFAFDEPTLEMCQREPVHATGIDRVLDPFQQKFCAKPMEFMSSRHAPIPIEVAKRCDTIIAGRSYCCPPYTMPSDWRVDSLPLGNDIEAGFEQVAEGAAQIAEGAIQDAGVIVEHVEQQPEVQRGTGTLRDAIREHPLLSVGLGILGGMVLGKMMSR